MTEQVATRARRLQTRVTRLAPPSLIVAGGTIVFAWAMAALFAPVLAPYDPIAIDLDATLEPPGPEHWLGTDHLGRDILSRIIYGTRVDLQMGLIGVIPPLLIGVFVGLVAGYYGGIADAILMRILDVTIAFPYLILLIAIIAVLGPGLTSYYISLALVAWVAYARLIRAEVLVLKHAEFVLAARTLGFGSLHIMARHILPNAISPVAVFVMTDIVLVILLGSGLSYLGLGAQPPTPEWGVMIADGQPFISLAWWICLFPGLSIVFLALGFSLLADGLAKLLRVTA